MTFSIPWLRSKTPVLPVTQSIEANGHDPLAHAYGMWMRDEVDQRPEDNTWRDRLAYGGAAVVATGFLATGLGTGLTDSLRAKTEANDAWCRRHFPELTRRDCLHLLNTPTHNTTCGGIPLHCESVTDWHRDDNQVSTDLALVIGLGLGGGIAGGLFAVVLGSWVGAKLDRKLRERVLRQAEQTGIDMAPADRQTYLESAYADAVKNVDAKRLARLQQLPSKLQTWRVSSTDLLIAARADAAEAMKVLLEMAGERAATLAVEDVGGTTAYHTAALLPSNQVLQLLRSRGAYIETMEPASGMTEHQLSLRQATLHDRVDDT